MFHHFTWMNIDICLSGKISLSMDFCKSQMNERCTIHVSDAAGEFSLKKAKLIHSTALLHVSLEKGISASCCSGIYISSLSGSLGMCNLLSGCDQRRGRINKYMPAHWHTQFCCNCIANCNERKHERDK
jgi:hypothetical protein